jgi:hypothetical protein
MFDVHPFFEQPCFQIICLFLHLFPFNVRCSFFQSLLGKNNLALKGLVATAREQSTGLPPQVLVW